MNKNKPIIYQLLPRLFTNINAECRPNGTIEQNGCGKLNHITPEVIDSIRNLGATHIWLTGVIEHATTTDYTNYGIARDHHAVVKGLAGSPYAIKDYYDIDPDLAESVPDRMAEFEALVERIHTAGLKVVMDFVPNHVARQYSSDAHPAEITDLGDGDDPTLYFGHNNNFYYIPRQQFQPSFPLDGYTEFPARATGNDCFTAFPGKYDWYETVKLNYGIDYGDHTRHFDPIPDTWFKMQHILRFWAAKGVDAFRCDMAHMVPLEFWRWALGALKAKHPQLQFIAEIYDVNLYRPYIDAGFDYLYDKVNLYDTLRGIQTSNLSAAQLTSTWQTVDGISDHMLNFLENHDEQRFGSDQYAGDPSKVMASLTVSATMGRGPMMIYMGQELGEQAVDAEGYSGHDGRTTIFDYWSVPTLRRWLSPDIAPHPENLSVREQELRNRYARLLRICNEERAISQGSFFDLMYVNYTNQHFNPHRHYTYLRQHEDVTLLVAVNFSGDASQVSINLPQHAFDCLGIKPVKSQMAKELLSGDLQRLPLNPDTPVEVTIPPYGAVIWRFKNRDENHVPFLTKNNYLCSIK